MEVRVNGKAMQVDDRTSVLDLVDRLGYGRRTVAVEHNGQPVDRHRYGDVQLRAGDVIEVVRPVQGGC